MFSIHPHSDMSRQELLHLLPPCTLQHQCCRHFPDAGLEVAGSRTSHPQPHARRLAAETGVGSLAESLFERPPYYPTTNYSWPILGPSLLESGSCMFSLWIWLTTGLNATRLAPTSSFRTVSNLRAFLGRKWFLPLSLKFLGIHFLPFHIIPSSSSQMHLLPLRASHP